MLGPGRGWGRPTSPWHVSLLPSRSDSHAQSAVMPTVPERTISDCYVLNHSGHVNDYTCSLCTKASRVPTELEHTIHIGMFLITPGMCMSMHVACAMGGQVYKQPVSPHCLQQTWVVQLMWVLQCC